MFTNSYIQVSRTFIKIELIEEYIHKLIKDTRSTIFENAIFETKVDTKSGRIFKSYMQFTIIKNVFNDFFQLCPSL